MLQSEQDEDQLMSFQRKAQLNSASQQLRMKMRDSQVMLHKNLVGTPLAIS